MDDAATLEIGMPRRTTQGRAGCSRAARRPRPGWLQHEPRGDDSHPARSGGGGSGSTRHVAMSTVVPAPGYQATSPTTVQAMPYTHTGHSRRRTPVPRCTVNSRLSCGQSGVRLSSRPVATNARRRATEWRNAASPLVSCQSCACLRQAMLLDRRVTNAPTARATHAWRHTPGGVRKTA